LQVLAEEVAEVVQTMVEEVVLGEYLWTIYHQVLMQSQLVLAGVVVL
jgi:hypothetical protein